jgi:broad specificity phosphatase PhoE
MATSTQRVCLVRHGETEWSLSGQHTGVTDIPLTENGRAVARRLRSILAEPSFTLVLTSPLRRARETCELAGLGASAALEPDLKEWDYGEYEGLTTPQIQARTPDWTLFRDGCPGGESPGQVGPRVDRVIARVRAVAGDAVVFAHGHVLRVLVARWIGLPPEGGQHFSLDTATLSLLTHHQGSPTVQVWNAPLQGGRASGVQAGQQALVHRARCNSAAALGTYDEPMERHTPRVARASNRAHPSDD